MKRKYGLHKRVSSIFGGVSPPDNLSVKHPAANNAAVDAGKAGTLSSDFPASDTGGDAAKSPYEHQPSASGSGSKATAKVSLALAEEQEYAASQRRKLYIVIGLFGLLALVLYFNFYEPGSNKKIDADAKTSSQSGIVSKDVEIYWSRPELWSADIRDPMVFREDKARLYAVESKIEGPFALRGIVHQPQGKSQVLIGIEILYEGDEIEGWIVREISAGSVRLQKPDGEELELKMEYR